VRRARDHSPTALRSRRRIIVVVALLALASQGVFAAAAPAESPQQLDQGDVALTVGTDTLAAVSQVVTYGPRGGGDCRSARCRPRPAPDPDPGPAPDPDPDPGPAPDPDPVPDPDPDPDPSPTPGPLPTPSGDRFDIMLDATLDGVRTDLWVAPYFRNLPYTNAYDVGWIDGDRVGYGCAYMFLEVDGQIAGRVTFTHGAEAGAYTFINDRFMTEGVRYYDGSLDTSGRQQLNDCPGSTEAYGAPGGPDYRPLIYYTQGGELLENRSYTNTNGDAIAQGKLIFRELERITQPFTDVGALGIGAHTVYDRVTVGAYVFTEGAWRLAIVVYYDTLVSNAPILDMIPAGATVPAAGTVANPDTSSQQAADSDVCRSGRVRGGAQECRVSRPGR